MGIKGNTNRRSQRGSALLIAIVATIVLASLAGAAMAVSGAFENESSQATGNSRALYVADAGLSEGIALVRAGAPANFGAPNPVPFGGGTYWGTVVDNGDDTTTVTAFASVVGSTRGLEAVMKLESSSIYNSALFAGNTSGDASYTMGFGGTGSQADLITGNIYSGGNIAVKDDAYVNGSAKAAGSIGGMSGTGGSLPTPDIAAMDYAVNNDVDVAALFAGGSSYQSDSLGGYAHQMPESSPAHIFRKNPSDRSSNTSSTVKDDYFLEDPYESVNTGSSTTVSSATKISLSGQNGNPGSSGTDLVYYIDGNLWVHNKKIYSFAMYNSGAEDIKVTFVVKGNVYFSDNILYQDEDKDGVAFVCIKDEREPDSGNIYFGDPTFGTLEQMDAFMFAENNFYDNNLSSSGSADVIVNGNMTASDQVLINRDWGTQHSRLEVNFDDRIMNGTLSMPGLPGQSPTGDDWTMASWREVSVP